MKTCPLSVSKPILKSGSDFSHLPPSPQAAELTCCLGLIPTKSNSVDQPQQTK
jgi:hypothetical protein